MTCLQHCNFVDRAIRDQSARRAMRTATKHVMTDVPKPRLKLIARIRRELVTGIYDIDGKFDRVIDRLLNLL